MKLIIYLLIVLSFSAIKAQQYKYFSINDIGITSIVNNNGVLASPEKVWISVGNGDLVSYNLSNDNWNILDEDACNQLTIDNTQLYPIYSSGDSLYFYYNWFGLRLYDKATNSLQLITTPSGSKNFKYVNGDIWFTVDQSSSLYKHDGSSITEFNSTNSTLPDSVILNFDIDNSGNAWLYYKNNLSQFNGTDYTEYSFPFQYNFSNRVKVHVNNDDVWLLNGSSGVIKFNNGLFTLYNSSNSMFPDDEIIYIASEGNKIWFVDIKKNITSYLNGSFENFNYLNLFPDLTPTQLNPLGFTIDKDGNKWVSTRMGVLVYNENNIAGNVSIKENIESDIQLFPNPSKNRLHIQFNKEEKEINKLSIVDIQSKLVKQVENDLKSIDISQLEEGYYFLKIELRNQTLVKSFVKH